MTVWNLVYTVFCLKTLYGNQITFGIYAPSSEDVQSTDRI